MLDLLVDFAGPTPLVIPLHGNLTPEEQQRVFKRPPRGVRKVILATNVAETSITIDDVSVVVDTGRVKQMTFDVIAKVHSPRHSMCKFSRVSLVPRLLANVYFSLCVYVYAYTNSS